jgi:hypothetical protein
MPQPMIMAARVRDICVGGFSAVGMFDAVVGVGAVGGHPAPRKHAGAISDLQPAPKQRAG